MRKAIVLLTVFLFLGVRVYAIESDPYGNYPAKTFTAFKSKMTSALPESTFEFLTLTTAEGKPIAEDPITTSESSRNTETPLFIWTASGTMAGSATISFEFSPLTLKTGEGEVLATIPYTVKITHKTSTVDGIQVAVNRDAGSATPQRCSFSSYRFNYSDTVKTKTGTSESFLDNLSVSADVNGKPVVLLMQYDMASGTVTKDSEGNIVKKNGKAISYPYNVTDLWVRTGECVITQKITADGKDLSSGSEFRAGWYSAQVTVSVISNT